MDGQGEGLKVGGNGERVKVVESLGCPGDGVDSREGVLVKELHAETEGSLLDVPEWEDEPVSDACGDTEGLEEGERET